MHIDSASIVVAASDQVSCDLENEAAVLNLKSGVYFGLDEVAASVWQLIQSPRSIADISAALTREYNVTQQEAESDVVELISEMMKEGLVEVTPGEASAS